MAIHNDLGTAGEAEAVKYLQSKKHQILETNWRSGKAEVDIISRDGKITVFSEVKTRTGSYFGYPDEAVSPAKQKLMAEAAENYMDEKQWEGEVRFDIISVVIHVRKTSIRHIRDAFFPIDD